MAKRKSTRPKCLNCGKPLPYLFSPKDQRSFKRWGHKNIPPVSRGYAGDGRFCSVRCGWAWANHMADDLVARGVKRCERWQPENPYPDPEVQPNQTGDDR